MKNLVLILVVAVLMVAGGCSMQPPTPVTPAQPDHPGQTYLSPAEALTRAQSVIGSTDFQDSSSLAAWAYGVGQIDQDDFTALTDGGPGDLVTFLVIDMASASAQMDPAVSVLESGNMDSPDGVTFITVVDGRVARVSRLLVSVVNPFGDIRIPICLHPESSI